MHIKSLVNEIETIPSESQFLFDDILGSNSNSTANKTLFYNSLESFKIDTILLSSNCDVYPSLDYIENIPFKFLSPFIVYKFNTDIVEHLTTSYKTFIPNVSESIPQLCRKHRCALWISERLKRSKHTSENFICVQAYWPDKYSKISTDCKTLWTGRLEYLFSQRICVSGVPKKVSMVMVKWFEEHPKKHI